MAKEKKEVTWRAAEYEFSKKDVSWYWLIGFVSATLVLLSLWQRNFFFAVFIIIAASMIMFFGNRRPDVINFRITEEGVHIGNTFTSFENIENFSARSRPNRLDEIILKKRVTVNPYVKIPLDSKLKSEARDFLAEKLPEIEYKESLVETFSDWLGF